MREQPRRGTKSAADPDFPCRGCLPAAFAWHARLLAEDAGDERDAIAASWPRSRRRNRGGPGSPSSGRRPRRRRQQSSLQRIPGRKRFGPTSAGIPESAKWPTGTDGDGKIFVLPATAVDG